MSALRLIITPEAKAYADRNNVRLVGVPESIAEPRRAGMVYYSSFMGEGPVEVLEIELGPCGCKTAKHRKTCRGPILRNITERTVGEDRIRRHFTTWHHRYASLIERNLA